MDSHAPVKRMQRDLMYLVPSLPSCESNKISSMNMDIDTVKIQNSSVTTKIPICLFQNHAYFSLGHWKHFLFSTSLSITTW